MAKISSSIKSEPYKIEITSPTGNNIIADEPIEMGGKDTGFSPKELLASSLAACTSATVKIYANNKGWDLKEIKIEVQLEFDSKENLTRIHRTIEFLGTLDDSQKKRLLNVANACPIHKILSNPVEIETILSDK